MSHPARLSHRQLEHALRGLVRDREATVYGVPVTRVEHGYRVNGGHTVGLLVAMDALMAAAGLRAVDAAGWSDDADGDDDVPTYGGRIR
jgi:hypothetical protein